LRGRVKGHPRGGQGVPLQPGVKSRLYFGEVVLENQRERKKNFEGRPNPKLLFDANAREKAALTQDDSGKEDEPRGRDVSAVASASSLGEGTGKIWALRCSMMSPRGGRGDSQWDSHDSELAEHESWPRL
jgi:hypothetical protein